MKKVSGYDDFLEEGYYYDRNYLDEKGKQIEKEFRNGDLSASDLRGLSVFIDRATTRRKLRLGRRDASMPKTGIWIDDDGRYCCEHYSSKSGLEVYGEMKFDNAQDLFRHIWLRIVKNGIPASLMSKRDVNEKIDFDERFPPGNNLTMNQILAELKPILGGEKLSNPSNDEMLRVDTVNKLLEIGLIGKYNYSKDPIVLRDISKGGKIKYYFYTSAIHKVGKIYTDLIDHILKNYRDEFNVLKDNSGDYETWTVTNTSRLPLNSVNFRTGENILNCRIQDIEMYSGIFVSLIKRTFERARGKNSEEKLISPTWKAKPEQIALADELNNLLSKYFIKALDEISPSVFISDEMLDTQVEDNAKALLLKYLIENGSDELKKSIMDNSDLSQYLDIVVKHKDIDALTRRIIRATNALKYV